MRIAVLGATGMLGRHTAQAVVDAGHKLTVIFRNPDSLKRVSGLPFDSCQADLNDAAALAKAFTGLDGVINAAAYYPTEPRPWRDDAAQALKQTENFYKAAESAKLIRIVYLGSEIALPKRSDGSPADGSERYGLQPVSGNGYLQSKWAMDEQALTWAQRGLPVVIGIPSMSFGEHDPGATTGRLVAGIASGKIRRYVRGDCNVVYAGDAGRGLVRALEVGVRGQRYLLTGTNTNMDELTRLIAAKARVAPPNAAPLFAAKLVGQLQKARWRWFGGPVPPISDTVIALMSAGQHLDGSSAKAIGYEPKVGLEETIERALRWARAQGQFASD